MCGIAGIIHFNQTPVRQEALQLMTDAIKHRGPDGEGFYVHDNIGFGHRRLAIIDLSEAGAQPMTRFGCTITYNGEIYNYIELRKELQQLGWQFGTQTDTEVVLAAYRAWGSDCVNRFNGMWAFALHDPARQMVFCSRDRFGEKPFYYASVEEGWIFGSEIRALRAAMRHTPSPSEKMMARFMVFEQAEHPTETFFEGIHKLPAAHSLEVDLCTGSVKLKQYYWPRATNAWQCISEADAVAELQSRFQKAVSLRLRSDVPVGTCLSGGLDSSAIAAFASKLYNPKVQQAFTGITAGSADTTRDETPYAKQVAEALGMAWKHCQPIAQDLENVFERVLDIQEEPFDSASVLMQHLVMQLAHDAGLKVLLDGQGADELLLGYKPHLAWAIKAMAPLTAVQLAAKSLNKYQIGSRELILLMSYHTVISRKRGRQLSKWKGLRKDLYQQLQAEASAEAGQPSDLFSKQCYELTHRILPMLLRYEDKNAMAFSIETRLPFLDTDLIEFLLNLPVHLKVNDGWSKYILRKSMTGHLPDAIVWRKGKVGFEAAYWVNQTLNPHEGMGSLFSNSPKIIAAGKSWDYYCLNSWLSSF
jgi:asparagine synthase (glutamine-hydrolysing)